ncbi:MAG: hypothetical protein ACAI44_05210 [Candidatus Sericytochromatia bacterium]
MKQFSRKQFLPLLASALSLSLVACGPNPGQTTPSPSPGTTASAPESPAPSASSPETSTGALSFRLQGDAALKTFSVMQAAGVCLADLKSTKTALTLAAAPSASSAAALVGMGFTVDGSTLTITSPVASLDALIAGIEVTLPALPAGAVSGETMLLNASGASMGSIKFTSEIATGGSSVSILLKPIAGTASTPGCPMLSADLSGASLVSLSGGLMLPVTVPSPSTSPSTAPSASASATPSASPAAINLPNPRNLQVVARSTDSLTLLWDFATVTGAHSYNVFLNGSKVASDVTSNTHAFGGLSPNTTYTLGVQTVSSSGVSEIVSVSGTTTTVGSVGIGNFSGGGSDSGGGGSTSSGGSGVTVTQHPTPVSEFLVNTYTGGHQYQQDAAMDLDGDYVVVWKDEANSAIIAQRYDEDSQAKGDPITVFQSTLASYTHPAVAMDDDGDFVVTWTGYGSLVGGTESGDSYSIVARRYNANGSPDGSAFQVNTYTTNTQMFPDVAMDSDGDFVIVWENNYNTDNGDGGKADIRAQRYKSSGSATGEEFVINPPDPNGANWDKFPAVAMDGDGDFVVVWPDYDYADDIEDYLIRGRRFSRTGSAKGNQFTVTADNNYVGNDKTAAPDVAMDFEGNFVVAWTYDDEQDGDNRGVYAQRYSSTGSHRGDEFQVNTITTDSQDIPSIGMDAEGDFVIAWRNNAEDGDQYGIFAQRYKSSGRVNGSEYQINAYTTSQQVRPKVAMADDGNFIVTWFSQNQVNGKDIFAGNGLD